MAKPSIENIFKDVLEIYLNYDESIIEELLIKPDLIRKERLVKINDLEVWIYSHDHDPPHFHVRTKERKIDAKFLIATGQYLSGEIDSKNIKKIMAFYQSPKTKILMQLIWNKRNK